MIHKLVLGIFIATIWSVFAALSGCSGNQAAEGFAFPPMPVEQAEVTVGTVTDRFDAVGTIEAIDAITVVAEIDALVRELPFPEGGYIKQGMVIAQLDDAQLQAELARAEAVRDQKKVTYDRVKSLADKGSVAAQEFDDASAALKIAEAELGMIQARLAKTQIVAPFAGTSGSRRVSPGAFVRVGAPITDLTKLDELKVTFAVPERFFPLLRLRAPVSVSTTAFPDREYTGTIEVIEPIIDKATRSIRVIAHVQNREQELRPGMSANVSAVLGRRDHALLIPDEAIFSEGSKSLVFVVKTDSTVSRTEVALGVRQSRMVEVLKGLEPSMMVVRAGHQKLREGSKVMPMASDPLTDISAEPGEGK